jgi:hypothetical protein
MYVHFVCAIMLIMCVCAQTERLKVLENAVLQHRYHIGRLEQIMRLLDNGDMGIEQVTSTAIVLLLLHTATCI